MFLTLNRNKDFDPTKKGSLNSSLFLEDKSALTGTKNDTHFKKLVSKSDFFLTFLNFKD